MTKQGIYIIQNTEGGTVYIGSTTDFRRRWAEHQNKLRSGHHKNPHLQSAWDSCGGHALEFDVLEYLDDPEALHLAEQFWMNIYREEGAVLYNYGLAARNPMLGRNHTEEVKQRISAASKGRKFSEETRRKLSEALLGRRFTEESRRRMSEAHKGSQLSEETKRKLSKILTGHKATEKTRRRMSEAQAGSYPAFIHRETGRIIPAGTNLRAMCRRQGLHQGNMCGVKMGTRAHHKGWMVHQEQGQRE